MTIFRPSRLLAASSLGILALAGLITFLTLNAQPKQPAIVVMDRIDLAERSTPVLVELFTSEGCSSCPPADALLANLLQHQPVAGAEIIVLEEHVDYWESLGWHDRFSSHQFTERQTAYANRLRLDSDYTPQMVVDGTDQFVGNDARQALKSIAQAARRPKPTLTLSQILVNGGHLEAIVSANAAAPLPKADLYAALVDTMASTDVKGGENGGRTLRHVSVLRSMQRIGSLETLSQRPVSVNVALANRSAVNTRLIVFAQQSDQGSVVAAASTSVEFTQPVRQLSQQ